jgi:nucleotide-binding universal stress UspA family protein
MQTILIPTDFSANALKAAMYAAEIAKKNNAEIHLLHAIGMGDENIFQPYTLLEKYNIELAEERKKNLEDVQQILISHYQEIKVQTHLAAGAPVESILDFCRQYPIDLILMGTQGAGSMRERLIGTVAASVVSRSGIPVLAVPDEYEPEEPDGILFLTSLFEEDEKLLAPIITLAGLFKAVVNVGYFIDVDKADAIDFMDGSRKMDHYLEFLSKKYPDVAFKGEIIEGKDFEAAIELYHEVHETDIAAMIMYPKGFWEKILQKSATKKMVFHSKTPVLAIPYISRQ